jgi:outer membrane receptor protein involved in Fe transport
MLLLFVSVPAWGQVASGTLLGEVRDESSALAPGVRITARHEPTGFSRSVVTNEAGAYRVENLLPGTYTVTTEKQGFRSVTTQSVLVEVNQKAELNLLLKVGPVSDSIIVVGDATPLQAGDASVGYRLDSPAITQLPLDVRNVISLATLGPGVIPRQLGGFAHDVVNDVQQGRGAVALNPPINGARSTMNYFTLDGAANTDRNTFAIAVNPPMEAVQEFRIQSSLAAAEFAQAGGGMVDVVTKAGGRAWHGSAFEYFRNEATDARNFFDDPALPRPIFRQSQFGGSLGGPLAIPGSFFFATYEGLRGKSAKSTLGIVPDAAARSGDFSAGSLIFDPLNLDSATGRRVPFPGNRIPAGRIDPIATKFLDSYEPLPNRTGSGGNYLDASPNENSNHNVSTRIDHEFRDHSRLFGRYTFNDERGVVAGAFPVLPYREDVRAQQAALGYSLAGSGWFNEIRLSFTRLRVFDVPQSAFRNDVARELGVTNTPSDPFTYGLPYFLITSVSTITDSPTLPQTQRDNLWNLSDGVSFARGRHTWKVGVDWVHFHLNYLQSRFARGQYIFTGAFTGNGDPMADFLLGYPQVTNRAVGDTLAHLGQNSYAGYVQDDWRVNGRLTFNFGLRYEYTAPFREESGKLLNLDYAGLPGPPRLVSVDSAVRADRNNWAPRLGLAFRPLAGRDFVFRAGYGVYFSPEIASETYDLIRNGVRNEQNQTDGSQAPILTLRNGFPKTASTGFPSYFGLDPNARTPYMQQWSAGVQQMLPPGILLEIAYVGSKGTKLGRFRQFNTPLHEVTGENLPPRPGDLQQLRPFPLLGMIVQRQNIASSTYNSLQIKASKRMAGRLTFLSSFVWSKSIDDADSVIPGLFDSFGAQDERNLRLERGLSFFNVGRRVSAGFVCGLPGAGLYRPILGGWDLSGIVTLQDGTPLNPVYFAFDPANTGTPNRPNVVAGQSVALPRDQRSADRFFNTDAFQAPKPYTFGNAGRNIIPGPGNNVFNLALHRGFRVHESQTLQLRAEFFNAFNHPNWGIPGPYPDFGPFFGKIFSTGDPRRVQFALRYEF